MSLVLVGLSLIIVIGLYFANNPMHHERWFMMRRFINWFPLGMTYAFLYMGRYNLNVSKNALGTLMTKEDFGIIFAAGTTVYAFSFLINGPLVDKIGGKKGIIISAIGSAVANIILGFLTYLTVQGKLQGHLVLTFSVVYALNMYFQSYGATSIIKVKAYWFHVRERGVFGAIFGTLISFGVYFAFDWCGALVDMTKPDYAGGGQWFHKLLRAIFAVDTGADGAVWVVFFVPAAIMIFWAIVDVWLIRDLPEEAGFPPFDTHDASSGKMDVEYTTMDLLKKVFTSRLMLLLALVELTAGVLRNGVYQWYFIFAKEVPQPGAEFFHDHWGLLLCMFGIVGGFAGGLISDKVYQSRRGPPAVILSGVMFVLTIIMTISLYSSPVILGWSVVFVSMAVIGVHSLMSGTAAADFGGRKATATCMGIVDGFVYIGSGIQSFGLGFLTAKSWYWWPVFLMPFALLGCYIAFKIWYDLPDATKKYIQENEKGLKIPVSKT